MTISIKPLSSGYYQIRGDGPCNWTQPPYWPCAEHVIRESAFPQASEEFIRAILRILSVLEGDDD